MSSLNTWQVALHRTSGYDRCVCHSPKQLITSAWALLTLAASAIPTAVRTRRRLLRHPSARVHHIWSVRVGGGWGSSGYQSLSVHPTLLGWFINHLDPPAFHFDNMVSLPNQTFLTTSWATWHTAWTWNAPDQLGYFIMIWLMVPCSWAGISLLLWQFFSSSLPEYWIPSVDKLFFLN